MRLGFDLPQDFEDPGSTYRADWVRADLREDVGEGQ
jgi:hypothetical protein